MPTTLPLSAFRITGGRTFEQARSVEIVDQLQLPHAVLWEPVSTIDEAFAAIKSMKIRGAPAIASLASLGIAAELLALLSGSSSPSFPLDSLATPNELLELILSRTAYLLTSRPTAVNLLEALTRIEAEGKLAVKEGSSGEQLARRVVDVAVKVWSEDKERNQRIGDNGANWILAKLEREGSIKKGEKISVLTVSSSCWRAEEEELISLVQVCNTGSLATSVRFFTAPPRVLALISLTGLRNRSWSYHLSPRAKPPGARLLRSDWTLPARRTSHEHGACELGRREHDGLRHGHRSPHRREARSPLCRRCRPVRPLLSSFPRTQLIIWPRIAANGDTANKISTYQISLLCATPHPFSPNPAIPVLIAAPITTLDLSMDSGRSIIIEQRPSWEACTVRGRVVDVDEMVKTGGKVVEGGKVQVETVLVTPPNTRAWNPAFDVTPAGLIMGIATELGVARRVESEDFDLRDFVARGGRRE